MLMYLTRNFIPQIPETIFDQGPSMDHPLISVVLIFKPSTMISLGLE